MSWAEDGWMGRGKKIIVALKAHTWSNLRLEEETGSRPSIPSHNTEEDINFESLKDLGLEVRIL